MNGQLLLFDPPPARDADDRRHHCLDCGVDTLAIGEYYVLHNHIWPIAPDGGMLCIGCVEERIGRRLTAADFTAAPVNTFPGRGRRLRDRQLAREQAAA
jgi:hypothetical protein